MAALPRAIRARVERLTMIGAVLPMALEEITAAISQCDRALVAVHRNARDQPLACEVAQVLVAYVSGVARVTYIPFGHNPEGPNGRERSYIGAAQAIVAIAVVNEFSIPIAWEIQIPAEHVSRVEAAVIAAVARLSVAFVAPVAAPVAHAVVRRVLAR